MDERYGEVFREHHAALVKGCTLAAGGDQGLAEDAVVEAFLRTYQPWRSGRVDDLGRYLRVVAVNEVRRLQARSARSVPHADPVPPGAASAADHGVADRGEAAALLAGLSGDERSVIVLRFWFDLREADVAEALDLPLGTVKSHAHRALRRLRATAADEGAIDA